MTKVKLLRGWLRHSIGNVVTVSDDTARWLASNRHVNGPIGAIEPSTTRTQMEAATSEPQTERATRKRARPRKPAPVEN